MDKKARFMEAVASKVGGKRAPVMKRKPGLAVMIAVGGPKPGMGEGKMEQEREQEREGMDDEKMPKAKKIAMLQEKIASLKAELALLEDEEDTAEDESESDESEYEDEEED